MTNIVIIVLQIELVVSVENPEGSQLILDPLLNTNLISLNCNTNGQEDADCKRNVTSTKKKVTDDIRSSCDAELTRSLQ